VVHLDRYGVFAVARHDQVQGSCGIRGCFSSAAGTGLANIAVENPWRKPSILLEVDPPVHTRNRKVVAQRPRPALADLPAGDLRHQGGGAGLRPGRPGILRRGAGPGGGLPDPGVPPRRSGSGRTAGNSSWPTARWSSTGRARATTCSSPRWSAPRTSIGWITEQCSRSYAAPRWPRRPDSRGRRTPAR